MPSIIISPKLEEVQLCIDSVVKEVGFVANIFLWGLLFSTPCWASLKDCDLVGCFLGTAHELLIDSYHCTLDIWSSYSLDLLIEAGQPNAYRFSRGPSCQTSLRMGHPTFVQLGR